ncbi:MAG: Crp/Fnr family transcriptional regulator [Chitinophagaceae bacterium]
MYSYLLRFIDLTDEEFKEISGLVELRHFNKKTKLIGIGEHERYMSFVVSGLVRKFFYRNNEEVITQIAKEGEFICSSVSFLDGSASEYVVESIEASSVISMSVENMEKLYEISPKMERLGRLVIIDWLIQKECWDNDRIKLSPKERFLDFMNQSPDLYSRVPQKFLASYLNIKPETFSRYKHLIQKPANLI